MPRTTKNHVKKDTKKQEKKSAYDVFQKAYEKNPKIVRKFIVWKLVIFVLLLAAALLANHYLLTPYFQSRFG